MGAVLWGIVIVLVVSWVLVKLILGIAGAAFHLLLVVAVAVLLYKVIRAGAERRVR